MSYPFIGGPLRIAVLTALEMITVTILTLLTIFSDQKILLARLSVASSTG